MEPIPADQARITMTAQEAATILGIPLRSVYEHIRKGLIPTISLGRRKLVLRKGVDDLIAEAMSREAGPSDV